MVRVQTRKLGTINKIVKRRQTGVEIGTLNLIQYRNKIRRKCQKVNKVDCQKTTVYLHSQQSALNKTSNLR